MSMHHSLKSIGNWTDLIYHEMSLLDCICEEVVNDLSAAEIIARQEQEPEHLICDLSIKVIRHDCKLKTNIKALERKLQICQFVDTISMLENEDALCVLLSYDDNDRFFPCFAKILVFFLEIDELSEGFLEVALYQGNFLNEVYPSYYLDTLYVTSEFPLQTEKLTEILRFVFFKIN